MRGGLIRFGREAYQTARLLAPLAIASSLGLGYVKVPIVAPFNLGLNGNAITVSPALHAAIMSEIDGDAREKEDRRDRPVDPDGVGVAEMTGSLHMGFIPLIDAAALIVAIDKGFTAAEGLDVTLVREGSWSNVRDKLNGIYVP